MRRRTALGLLLSLILPRIAWGRASPEDAQAMVHKAIELCRERGRDGAMREISRADGPFVSGELYVTVHALDGMCLADIDTTKVGHYMWMEHDPDDRYFTRDRLQAAKEGPSGWQEYKQLSPVSHRMQLKRTYWERYQDLVFACGFYKSLMSTM